MFSFSDSGKFKKDGKIWLRNQAYEPIPRLLKNQDDNL
jgi:hypothetical protein